MYCEGRRKTTRNAVRQIASLPDRTLFEVMKRKLDRFCRKPSGNDTRPRFNGTLDHSEPNVSAERRNPGHARHVTNLAIVVHDLRR